jgi:hypothetical protein
MIWLVAYSVLCGLEFLILVCGFLLLAFDMAFQIVLGFQIGESVGLFTLWLRRIIVNTDSLQFEYDVHC